MDPNDEALSEPFIEEPIPPLRPAPVMDIVPPPPSPASDHKAADAKQPTKQSPAKKSESLKQPRTGVTTAITATVIIVLSLAGLAVFAYLKSQK